MKRKGQLSLDFMVGMAMVFLFVGAAVVHLGGIYKAEQTNAATTELQVFTTTLAKNIDNLYSYGANFQEIMTLDFKYLSSVTITVSNGQVKVTSVVKGTQYTATAPIHAKVQLTTITASKGDKLLLQTTQVGGEIYVEVKKLS